MTTVLVMAKTPVPGRVKTRLTPPFTPVQAAALAAAALEDTMAAVLSAPVDRRVLVLDGEPGPWVPPQFEVLPQVAGTLDVRIAAALAACDGPSVVIGMDTPQLTSRQLDLDFTEHDAWFGPAVDGGYWALGLREPDPAVVLGVPMSVPDTGAAQCARLRAHGLRFGTLPLLRDVDTATCAAVVAEQAPDTAFARLHSRLTGAARVG